MCTISWEQKGAEGFAVYFNRDEQKSRPVARPPEVKRAINGVRYLAPTDPTSGGTWLAASERGLVLALLNRWHEGVTIESPKSRGVLIPKLIGLDDQRGVLNAVKALNLSKTPPFTLVVLGPDCSGQRCDWDGVRLLIREAKAPITSSSYEFENVRDARLRAFETATDLEDFHASEGEEPTAFSVRMRRADAQTWSRSVIEIEAERVRFSYWAEAEDLEGEGEEFEKRLGRIGA